MCIYWQGDQGYPGMPGLLGVKGDRVRKFNKCYCLI